MDRLIRDCLWAGFTGLWLAGLMGCGSLGDSARLPNEARTLEVPVFLNRTDVPGLETELTKYVSLAVVSNGRLQWKEAGADLRLIGEIQQFRTIPLRRDENQRPIQFKMVAAIDMELLDLRKGSQMWTTHPKVHLTPVPAGHDEESFDSLNTSTLKVSEVFWGLNSLGNAAEDPEIVKQRLLKLAADKVLRKVLTGFYGGTP